MSVLWLLLVVGVCDVALCMEGPRGKVTREMCSKPASQVPEEHWPYCCEGYGKLCEDFAASCYLDCQPVVSSGSDVTLVEERPGFCCALYNFCCAREFSRIGDLQKVQIEERFPIFHRFHGPGKIAPRGPAPRKNKAKQDVKNDISEISNTVNRIGHPRQSSRNNEPRVHLDRFDSNAAKSLELEVSRSTPQQKRSNQKLNVVKPQRSPARFPHRPQNDKNKENNRPTSPRLSTSNLGQLKANNEHSVQSDDSFGKITPNKKTETQAKNTNNVEDRKNINESNQQLNEEAENRKITLNRAGVSRIENESKTNPSLEAANDENQEKLTPTKQFKRVSIPRIIKRQPEIKIENNSQDKQVKKEEITSVTTEEPITARPSNGRKVKLGKRVLVRTATKKISNSEQENLKPIESVQNNQKVKPIASRRTLINNRQTGSRMAPKKINNNEPEVIKSIDFVQNNQEVQPIASRRTILSNRQTTPKKISNNEQEVLKSIESVQNNQEIKPVASRRTLIRNRPTNSRTAPKKISNNEQETLKFADSVQNIQEVKPTASRRTLISNRKTGSRTVLKKISSNEQEILKSTDSAQNDEEVKPTASRRTLISNRQTTNKKVSNNEQEVLKLVDSIQNKQEIKPTGSSRTLISNRQTNSRTSPKKINDNEQEILKSNDSEPNNQEIKPNASRRTVISNRQTSSRRSRPTASNTKESPRLEKNQDESTASRGTNRNNGRRIKQTVRRISSDKTTQNESVRLPTSTLKVPQKILPARRISTSNKPVVNKSVVLASDLEKQNVKLDAPQISKSNITLAILRDPFNATKSTTLSKETKAPILDLDTSETQTSEAQKIPQNNLKISKEEKDITKDKTETESLQQAINANIQKIVRELTEKNLKQLEMKKGNTIIENKQENKNSSSIINNPSNRQGRTRIRIKAPTAIESREALATVTGGNSEINNTRTRSRGSRTRNQESTQQRQTSTSTSTNRGTSRRGRAELFGRKQVSETPVPNTSEKNESTTRRTTRRRGRQPT